MVRVIALVIEADGGTVGKMKFMNVFEKSKESKKKILVIDKYQPSELGDILYTYQMRHNFLLENNS